MRNSIMTCPWCNYDNGAAAEFCGECGRSLQLDMECPDCRHANPRLNRFCDACGSRISTQGPPERGVLPAHPPRQAVPHERTARPSSPLLVVVPVAAAIILGVVGQHYLVEERRLTAGLFFWAASLVFFIFGLWQARYVSKHTIGPVAEGTTRRWPLARIAEGHLVVAVIAVGVFLRIFKFGSFPPGLNHDAAWNGLHAIRITQGASYSPYVAEAWGRETMFHHVIAFFQLILGPTQWAIQVASITVGIATLVAFYFLVRRLFGFRLALVATYLLSVSGWHVTMSNVGWRAILVPLFIGLVFYFLVKAVQERRLRDCVFAGIFLGLSLNTYDAARVLPFAAAGYLIFEIIRTPTLIRTNYIHLALFGFFALLAFSPLGWYALHNWDAFMGRASFLWIGAQIEQAGSIEPLLTNIKDALLMFNYRANGNDFFVEEPLLDLPVSVFFTLGLVYSIAKWRQPGYFLLLVMLLLILVVGIASVPNGNRGIGAIVPVTILSAVLIVEAWRWLSEAYPRHKDLFTVALVGVLVYAGYATYDSYLGPDRRVQWGFYPETTRVGRYMHDIAPENEIYAAAVNWPRDALTYLSYQGEGEPFAPVYRYFTDATQLLLIQPAPDRGTVFIIEAVPQNATVLNSLHRRFPSAVIDEIYYPDGSANVIAHALRVPPNGGSANSPPQPNPPVLTHFQPPTPTMGFAQ